MTKYKNKYRTESIRLPEWDYNQPGWYFITICVKNHKMLFGKIHNSKMHLSSFGEIAQKFLIEIPQHFSHTKIDIFVVMPNHIHAIIVIHKDVTSSFNGALYTQNKLFELKRKFGPLSPSSLSSIVQVYKSSVTRKIRKAGYSGFAWQAGFYDHIIRNEESLNKIREYIQNNPLKWSIDKYYMTEDE